MRAFQASPGPVLRTPAWAKVGLAGTWRSQSSIRWFPLFLAMGVISSAQATDLTQAQIQALQKKLIDSRSERSASATAGYSQLIGFVSDPELSGFTLNVGQAGGSRLELFKLPFRHELSSAGKGKWFVRGAVNHASIHSENLLKGLSPDVIEPRSSAFSALVGVLRSLPLTETWSFSSALDAGVARIQNEVRYQGANALQAKPFVENLLIDWSTDAALLSGALGLDYRKKRGSLDLAFKTAWIHTWISSFHESGAFKGFNDQTDLLHVRADFEKPLRQRLSGLPLSGLVHLGTTTFLGSNRHALGFSHLNSMGFAVKADARQRGWRVQSLTLGLNYLVGDGVDGYEIVFGYQF